MMPMMMPSSHAMMAQATGYRLIIRSLNSHSHFRNRFIYRSYLVMVSVRVGPRPGDGCVSKNFQGLVERRYANEFPQETCVRRFLTPFVYLILMYLLLVDNRCDYYVIIERN